MKLTKKRKDQIALVNRDERYSPSNAIDLLKKLPNANFDESVELHVKLGIDPKQADQQLRGTFSLPQGSGKKARIVAVCKDNLKAEAIEAGAIDAGETELIEKIGKGWFEFDILITSPEMMSKLGKLGRTLGSKGLMPNIKSGTISKDLVKTVKEFSKGKMEYRNDKYGNMHFVIGRKSFTDSQLLDNFNAVYSLLEKEKPAKAKGIYIESISLSSTMGPGVWIETMKNKWSDS